MTQPRTRAQRLAAPLARDVVRQLAIDNGGCIRPIQLRKTNLSTGREEQILVPCGHTLATVCPACAERAKTLRAAQCRAGWHLDHEPILEPDDPDKLQRMWVEWRATTQASRDRAEAHGQHTGELDQLAGELDDEITRSGVRGKVLATRSVRRHRSTRRRQDAPDLPRRKIAAWTVGKTYAAPDGKTFRPSMFLTLTCPSYGRVRHDGTPVDPDRYDYQRAARDALSLRRALRSVHPKSAPLPWLRRSVLRGYRATTPPRPTHPHRHPRHRVTRRVAPSHHDHLPPRLVATNESPLRRRPPARVGRTHRQLRRCRHRRGPADLG